MACIWRPRLRPTSPTTRATASKCSGSSIRWESECGECSSRAATLARSRVPGRTRRFDHRDAQSAGGPSDVEADAVAFAQHIDAGKAAALRRAGNFDEWELEQHFASLMRAHGTAPARSVQAHNHPAIEIAGKAF